MTIHPWGFKQSRYIQASENTTLCHGWHRLSKLPRKYESYPLPRFMRRWSDLCYHAYARGKQPWHQNPWCSHLTIFWLLQIWPALWISTNCVRHQWCWQTVLEQETCTALGMISPNFPTLVEVLHSTTTQGPEPEPTAENTPLTTEPHMSASAVSSSCACPCTNTLADPLPSSPSGHSFMTGIRRADPPPSSYPDDQLASLAFSTLHNLAITWNRVQLTTTSDQDIIQLVSVIESGFPKFRHELPPPLQVYYQFKEHTLDGVILYRYCVVIPPSLWQNCLTTLHSTHQGVTSMTWRAETTVFWPGITTAIRALWETCSHSNRMAPSQPSAPPYPLISPAYPFQCVCADFFHYKGTNYLVIVDRYSNWPIVARAQAGSKGLVGCLCRTFTTFGIPDECTTDSGPEFTATATRQCLKGWGIHHFLSSGVFPHSNCHAEIGANFFECLITNNTDAHSSLATDS